MTVIPVSVAMEHVRAEEYDLFLVQRCLEAAEDRAQSFLQRSVYADADALAAAKATVATIRTDARAAYQAAVDAAALIEDSEVRAEALADAKRDRDAELARALQIQRGMVITPAVRAACLLITGHLYENRENVSAGVSLSELPQGAESLLWPHRAGVGV